MDGLFELYIAMVGLAKSLKANGKHQLDKNHVRDREWKYLRLTRCKGKSLFPGSQIQGSKSRNMTKSFRWLKCKMQSVDARVVLAKESTGPGTLHSILCRDARWK